MASCIGTPGSVCAGFDCSSIALGDQLARVVAVDQRFEIDEGVFAFLPAGRYVLRIGGFVNDLNGGAYSGQLATFAFAISEAGTARLFALGLAFMVLVGIVSRRKHRRP